MISRRSRDVLVTVLVTFSLAAAGCSSGGGDSNDTSDDIEVPADTNDGSSSGGGNSDCVQLANVFDADSLDASVARGLAVTDSAEEEDFEAAAEFLNQASDDVPAEISDDIQVLADTQAELAANWANIDWNAVIGDDDAAFNEAVAKVTAPLLTQEYIEATLSLSDWIDENCAGSDLGGQLKELLLLE